MLILSRKLGLTFKVNCFLRCNVKPYFVIKIGKISSHLLNQVRVPKVKQAQNEIIYLMTWAQIKIQLSPHIHAVWQSLCCLSVGTIDPRLSKEHPGKTNKMCSLESFCWALMLKGTLSQISIHDTDQTLNTVNVLKFWTLNSNLFWAKFCFLCTCCLKYLVEWQTV